MDSPLICTVLPTYNESGNIAPLIEGVLSSAQRRQMVLVVDDNSPDGTGDVVRQLLPKWNRDGETRLVLHQRVGEKGLTSAIQRGIDLGIYTFNADVITWMDCDLSMPPEDVPRLVEAVLQPGVDMAVGSRWIEGGADVAHDFTARTLSCIINTYAALMLGWDVTDYTSGFIAARAEVLKRIRLRGDYGEYCIDLLGRAQSQGFHVVEVPYVCVPRTAGESKTGANLLDYLEKGQHYVTAAWNVRFGQ